MTYGAPYLGPTLSAAVNAVGGGAALATGPIGTFFAAAAGVTGAAIGTTSAPALYNPPASNKILYVQSIRYGDVSGTIIRANIRYYWQQSPVLSGLTEGAIQARSRGVASVAKWYTALTVGAAATIFTPSGLGSGGAIAAQFYNLKDDPAGLITINPGEIFWPYVSNAALAMVADVGIWWIEAPIYTGN